MEHFTQNWLEAKHQAVKDDLKIVEHGWEQHVIIDERKSIVYRFPRHDSAANKLKDEVGVLKSLHQLDWDVQIPEIIEHTSTYTSYKYIPGDVLNHHTLAHLHLEKAEHIGEAIGDALAILHGANKEIISHKSTKQIMSLLDYYVGRIESKKNEYTENARKNLDELKQKLTEVKTQPVVVHGDLHGLNIVIDKQTNTLRGIIDFSETEIGDPHQDFRKIFMTDERLLAPAIRSYGETTRTELDNDTVRLWAYVNEWANMCHFADSPGNETFKRAQSHLKKWGQI